LRANASAGTAAAAGLRVAGILAAAAKGFCGKTACCRGAAGISDGNGMGAGRKAAGYLGVYLVNALGLDNRWRTVNINAVC